MKAIILIILLTVSFGAFDFDGYRNKFNLPEFKSGDITCVVNEFGDLTITYKPDREYSSEIIFFKKETVELMIWLNKVYGKDKY